MVRMGRRILAAVVLVAMPLTGCSDGKDDASSVGKAGGVVKSASGDVQVRVPAGAVTQATNVRFDESSDGPKAESAQDFTGSFARPIGNVVEITPATKLPGARVEFLLDEDALPSVNGRAATPANAFIAGFNETIGAWVPLDTSYDATSHRLSAVAPHFSFFRTWVVDPAKAVWSATKKAAEAFSDAMLEAFGAPEQKQAECPDMTLDWEVKSADDAFSGCVEPLGNGRAALRLENSPFLGYVARVPIKADLRTNIYDADLTTLSAVSLRGMHAIAGALAMPPKGRAQLTFAESDVPVGSRMTVPVQPDALGLAVETILTMLNWIPDMAVVRTTAARASVRAQIIEAGERSITTTQFFAEVTRILRQEVKKPEALTTIGIVNDAINCLTRPGTSAFEIDPNGSVKSDQSFTPGHVIELAKTCLTSAVEAAERITKRSLSDVISLLGAIPDTARIITAIGQGGLQGFKHWGAATSLTVIRTALPQPPPPTTAPPVAPTTQPPAVDPGSAPRELSCEPSEKGFAVRWDWPISPGFTVTGYRVKRTDSPFTDNVPATNVVVGYQDLETGKKYKVKITTLSANGPQASASIICTAG